MNDLTEFFKSLIIQHRATDIAEAEFRRILADDTDLQEQYSLWCEENDCSAKNGFKLFCDEFLESQDTIWQSLNDYDEY